MQQMTATPPVPAEPTRRGRLWVKVLLAVLCVLSLAMWVYGLVFAPSNGVYQVSDKNWRLQAKPICVAAYNARLALTDTTGGYITDPTPEQMRQRADIVDKATDIVEKMVTDIVAIPVASDRDRLILKTFEGYYRMVINDRRRYTASLRAGKLVKYTETVVAGGPVSNVVFDFTADVKGNDIPDCSPPTELGGDIKP